MLQPEFDHLNCDLPQFWCSFVTETIQDEYILGLESDGTFAEPLAIPLSQCGHPDSGSHRARLGPVSIVGPRRAGTEVPGLWLHLTIRPQQLLP